MSPHMNTKVRVRKLKKGEDCHTWRYNSLKKAGLPYYACFSGLGPLVVMPELTPRSNSKQFLYAGDIVDNALYHATYRHYEDKRGD